MQRGTFRECNVHACVHWRALKKGEEREREREAMEGSLGDFLKSPPSSSLLSLCCMSFACCNRPGEAAASTFTDFSPPRVWMLYHKPRECGRWRSVSWAISCSSSLLCCSIVSSMSFFGSPVGGRRNSFQISTARRTNFRARVSTRENVDLNSSLKVASWKSGGL